jgi:hypothetical protein
MPVLFLGLVGVYYWVRRDRTDLLLWLSGVSFVVPLVVVSAFNGWHGGASVCARYLVPALPWLCLSLKELPSSRRWSLLIACLGAISLLNMLAVAATNPVSPENVFEPLYTWVYPEFVAGNFGEIGQPTRLQALHPAWPEIAPLTCFNLGEVMGLSGYPSLLPWLLVCAAIGRFLYKRTAREAETPSVARQDQGAVGAD